MVVQLNTNLKFVFASTNIGKLKEVELICKDLNWECISPTSLVDQFGPIPDVTEGEISYWENAKLKALHFYNWCNLYPVIADDTGLEVTMLNGKPGVKSARYAGENASMSQNKQKLLAELSCQSDLSCAFKCTLCFYNGHNFLTSNGLLEGHICTTSDGSGGFGYDDLFIPKLNNPQNFTLAKLKETSYKATHRYQAFVALKASIDFKVN